MDYQNSSPRPMVQGKWTCSDCGAAITELPFQPDGSRPISCRDCHRQRRNTRRDYQPSAPREMVQGNWQCAGCGTDIHELPFRPSGDRPIYCRDCHRSQRG